MMLQAGSIIARVAIAVVVTTTPEQAHQRTSAVIAVLRETLSHSCMRHIFCVCQCKVMFSSMKGKDRRNTRVTAHGFPSRSVGRFTFAKRKQKGTKKQDCTAVMQAKAV